MSMRGFSKFEQMFRQRVASNAPIEVLKKKKQREGLTEEEIQEYKITFEKFDFDHGGTIDAQELGRLVRVLGLNPSDDEVETLKNEIDTDGSGEIDFQEFCEIMNSDTLRSMQVVDDREARLRNSFKKIETSDGRLRKDDISKLLTRFGSMKMSAEEVQNMLDMIEKDEDGLYRKEDFINLLTE